MKPGTVIATLILWLAAAAVPGAAQPGALPASPGADATAATLRAHARPLRDVADLDPILDMIGERRAVLLGEASHGTEDYYTWRAELSRRLIAERGFRFIAVEGDWGASMAVNRYVKHMDDAPGSAEVALASYTRWPTWLWSNAVVLELVEWLREHNADLPPSERVGFYGIDVYGLDESMDKALSYLAELDEAIAAEAGEAYACLQRHDGDMRRYLDGVMRGEPCSDEIAAIVVQLRARRADWQAADPDAYFHAKQNALVVQNAERHYRAMIAQNHASWNARAGHFHLTLERLLERYGEDSKGIVWAHNTHIGDARATSMRQQRLVNIGQLARESLGRERVALVGFGTHRGEVVAGSSWGAPQQVMQVPRAIPGSLEDVLLRVGEQPFLLLMDEVRDVPGLAGFTGHRAIGVTYDPRQERGNYVATVLPERYDAFIFIPVTTALP